MKVVDKMWKPNGEEWRLNIDETWQNEIFKRRVLVLNIPMVIKNISLVYWYLYGILNDSNF
jgi:hypothetical protein